MFNKQLTLQVARLLSRQRSAQLSLSAIAKLAGWSPYYLQRQFKALIGESPKQFQQRLSLEEAALQLSQTDDSILTIAVSTGHESHEVFSRAFRRRFKCSPSEYRNQARQNLPGNTQQHAELVRRTGPCISLYHTTLMNKATNNRKREPVMPTSEITHIELESIPVLYIQRRVPHTGFQELFAECFPKLYTRCMQNAYEMAGHPIARYVEFTPGMATVDCIIPLQRPVQGPVQGDGEILAGELAAGPAAFATHSGPYETLNETYTAIEAWLETQQLQQSGPNWEWYVTDPGEVPDPAQWKTEVYYPVKPRGQTM